MDTERFMVGNGGWVRYERGDLRAAVRFARQLNGELEPADLVAFATSGSLAPRDIRRVPLGRIAEWAAVPRNRASVLARLEVPGPDVRKATDKGATSFGVDATVADVLKASSAPEGLIRQMAPESLRARAFRAGASIPERLKVRAEPRSRPLKRPEGKAYPVAFYTAVAERYRFHVSEGRAPAAEIAAEAGVPLSTAQRWVKRARALKVLGASRGAGKRGESDPTKEER